MELHLECRGRWFKSNRIEKCVAQFGRARMFHQTTCRRFNFGKRMPKGLHQLVSKTKSIFSKLVASLSTIQLIFIKSHFPRLAAVPPDVRRRLCLAVIAFPDSLRLRLIFQSEAQPQELSKNHRKGTAFSHIGRHSRKETAHSNL